MKQIIFQLLFVTSLFYGLNWLIKPIYAQEINGSATPSSEEVTKANLERIKRIIEEKGEKINGAIDQISQQKRGFIGQVQRVTAESITLINHKGTEMITLDNNVSILKNAKEINVADIAVKDWLIVMGLIENEIFTPKRILVSSTSLRPKDHFVQLGTITALTKSKITILSRQSETFTLDLNKNTKFEDKQAQITKQNLFTEDIQVLVVGYQDEKGKTATHVRALISLESLNDN